MFLRSIRHVAVAIVCLSAAASAQNTIRVPTDYGTIQAAIIAARNGDTVRVAPGTYNESINFLGKAISVTSEAGAEATIIDGGRRGPAVSFVTRETTTSVLSGFTIQNGSSASGTGEGGGITVQNSSPTIRNNRIINNSSCTGHGIGIGFGSPVIQGNLISNNAQSGCSGGLGGGGISVRGASRTEILENVITNNAAGTSGGGISLFASGPVTIRGNVITGNTASSGGAIAMVNDSPAMIVQNLMARNSANGGAAMNFSNPPAALINNTIAENLQSPAIVGRFTPQTRVINNIIAGVAGQPAIRCETFGGAATVPDARRNIVYTTNAPAWGPGCIDPTGGNGNVTVDPRFADAAGGNFRLQADSPARDAGDDSLPEIPALDLDGNQRKIGPVDLGAYEHPGPTTLSLAPASLSFAAQVAGTTSAAQTVTVTNSGGVALQVSSVSVPGEFVQTNTCQTGAGLRPGGTCVINVSFRPGSRGSKRGAMAITSNASGSPHLVELTGTAIAAAVTFNPAQLTFEEQQTGTSSAARTATLTNSGDAPLQIQGIGADTEFSQTSDCGTALAVGASCSIQVTFTPIGSGPRTGRVTVTSSAPESPHALALSGTGRAPTPVIADVTPGSVVAGSGSFVLVVNGSDFVSNSVVRWNGAERPTTFAGGTRLTAAIPASDIASGGTARVTVFSQPPGGGESAAREITINNPLPRITSLTPSSVLVGTTAVTLVVTGAGFTPAAVVRWNGDDRPTTFANASQLRVALTASDLASPASVQVNVFQPAPGGGTSNTLNFAILVPNPMPVATGMAPVSTTAGGASFTLRVTGRGFVSGSAVQWNRSSRQTAFVSESELQATITAADIAAGGTASVTVFNPPPDGGISDPLTFTIIGNPRPNLSSLSPQSVPGGGPGFRLTVNGSGFSRESIVRWNDEDRPTTYVSASQVTAEITAAEISRLGSVRVTVFNPPPGGGLSNAFTISITENPVPRISSVNPGSVAVRAPEVNITVSGGNFTISSVVRWNGMNRPTTFISSGELRVTLASSDVANPALAELSVLNPPLGGGSSNTISVPVYVNLPANDLVYDGARQRLYASVPSTVPLTGNSVAAIAPLTGAVLQSVFVGSEPGKMAISDDARYLYVALDGAASIRRVDLTSFTADLQFALGNDPNFGSLFAEDIAVFPGNSSSIAVSLRRAGVSPRHGGVAIFDNGVRRPLMTANHTGSNVIEFSSSPTTLYGYNNETTDFGFRTMTIEPAGLNVTNVASSLISGFGVDIKFDAGLIYSTSGRIIDPVRLALNGTYSFPPDSSGLAVAPDSSTRRTFFLAGRFGSGPIRLLAYDQRSFTPTGSVEISGVTPRPGSSGVGAGSLVRWGDDGLAFRSTGNQVFVFRSPLVGALVLAENGTVNAASFAPGPVAAGSLVSTFGPNLGIATASANGLPLPTSLAGVGLQMDGRPVPLLFVSPGQVNFQVPWELAGRTEAELTVTASGAASPPRRVALAAAAPGIFVLGPPEGQQGAVLIANTPSIAAVAGAFADARPARRGELISIFCTGLGAVTNPPATGAAASSTVLSSAVDTPTVTIGGRAAAVSFAGLSPGFVGLYQINAEVPPDAATGAAVPIVIAVRGAVSNTAVIAVE